MANNDHALLVTGASGQLGRLVLEHLLAGAAKGRPIVAATRSPEKLAGFAARGVQVRAANFDDPATLAPAFRGVERALIVSTDALDRPGHRMEQHLAAVRAAKAAGVAHVVYTSLVHPDPDSLVTIAPDHFQTEQVIAESGLGHTVLRNNLYTDYLVPGVAYAVKSGKIANAYGAGKVGYVTREDCARAAAFALGAPFTGKAVLDVTGPEAITQTELAAIVSKVTGRRVEYAAIDRDMALKAYIGAGLPAPVAELMVSFDLAGAAGQLAAASSAVLELTGTPPTSVADFLERNRAAL
jgi:NAD(P)H dehydrogenase (quinone)